MENIVIKTVTDQSEKPVVLIYDILSRCKKHFTYRLNVRAIHKILTNEREPVLYHKNYLSTNSKSITSHKLIS